MIRPATLEDVDSILRLLCACDLFNESLDYSTWSHPTLVFETDERIVGMCQMILGQPYACMTEIAVHPDYWDKGISRTLVDAMEAILKDCGIKAWYGLIMEWHEPAIKRIEHMGAKIHGKGIAYMKGIA